MTGPGVVRWEAPGKLFIAGEYAVMEPGRPAILVAVDQHVSVTVAEADLADVEIDSDLCATEAQLYRKDGGLVGLGAEDLGPVVAALEVVDELLAERGQPALPTHITIRSRLHRNGTKFGLGSSGAVTVATVSAVAAYNGIELDHDGRFRLAMLATARREPGSSGGDLAASVWGGWIAYQAPDRYALVDLAQRRGIEAMLRTPLPGYVVRPLSPPRGLALEVGWTGEPVVTSSLAASARKKEWRGTASHQSFVDRSEECVRAAIRALESGDDGELLHRIRDARRLLAELGEEVGLGIFTPKLLALCDTAEAVGGAGKPSGAGGGDCGIALLDATAHDDITKLRDAWTAAGVQPLPMQIQPTNGSAQ